MSQKRKLKDTDLGKPSSCGSLLDNETMKPATNTFSKKRKPSGDGNALLSTMDQEEETRKMVWNRSSGLTKWGSEASLEGSSFSSTASMENAVSSELSLNKQSSECDEGAQETDGDASTVELESDSSVGCISSIGEEDPDLLSISSQFEYVPHIDFDGGSGIVKFLTPDSGNFNAFGSQKSCSIHDCGFHPKFKGASYKTRKVASKYLHKELPSRTIDCILISNPDVNCYLALEKMLFRNIGKEPAKFMVSEVKCVILGGVPQEYVSKSESYNILSCLGKLLIRSPQTVIFSSCFKSPLNCKTRPGYEELEKLLQTDISFSQKLQAAVRFLRNVMFSLNVGVSMNFFVDFIPQFHFNFSTSKYIYTAANTEVPKDDIPYLNFLENNDYTIRLPLTNFSCVKDETKQFCVRESCEENADVVPIIFYFKIMSTDLFFCPGDLRTVVFCMIYRLCQVPPISVFMLSHGCSKSKVYNDFSLLSKFESAIVVLPWSWKFKNPSKGFIEQCKRHMASIHSLALHPVTYFVKSKSSKAIHPEEKKTLLGIFTLNNPLHMCVQDGKIKLCYQVIG